TELNFAFYTIIVATIILIIIMYGYDIGSKTAQFKKAKNDKSTNEICMKPSFFYSTRQPNLPAALTLSNAFKTGCWQAFAAKSFLKLPHF
ncbi:MAG: hypothetical protein JKY60_19465, partial [Kordiimonadaceae bacterium]|nr:hypothetical protein [Kordiimonadaceae bacterium]